MICVTGAGWSAKRRNSPERTWKAPTAGRQASCSFCMPSFIVSVHYFIPLHLRFLDIQYRRKKGRRGEGKRNLYNKIVWPILYKEVFPELKFGLTDEVRQQIRQQLEQALNP